jgi:hypothetical protein
MFQFYKNLKPLHLYIIGTIFFLLSRVITSSFKAEFTMLSVSLIIYILALVKYFKK